MDLHTCNPLSTTREFFGRISSPRLLAGVAVVTTWVMVVTFKNQQRLESLLREPIQSAITTRSDELSLSSLRPNFLPLDQHSLEPAQKCKLTSVTHRDGLTTFSLQMRLPPSLARSLTGVSKPEAVQLDLVSSNPSFEPSRSTYADLVSALETVDSAFLQRRDKTR